MARGVLKLNMYSALLWLKKKMRLHVVVVVFWGSLLHNLNIMVRSIRSILGMVIQIRTGKMTHRPYKPLYNPSAP